MAEEDIATINREAWAGFVMALAEGISRIDRTNPPIPPSQWIVEQIQDTLETLIAIEDSFLLQDEEAMRKMMKSFLLAYEKVNNAHQ